MDRFRLFIVLILVCISTTIGNMTMSCSKHSKCYCKSGKELTVVLFKYPPWLESIKNSSHQIQLANIGRVRNCYKKFKNCLTPKKQWRVEMEEEEYLLNNTINKHDIDVVYPIPVDLYEKYKANETQYKRKPKGKVRQLFIPIKESKLQLVFINIQKCQTKCSELIFKMLSQQWPVMTIIVLTASIAGIIIWLLESGVNKDFSSSFYSGSWDGIWWAFVSMATVGYGDKTPHGVFGRVFGVLWILVGIVLFSFFTATITSAITIATVKKSCGTIESKDKVAVLRGSNAVKYVTDNTQGLVEDYSGNQVVQMIDDLNSKNNGINFMLLSPEVANQYSTQLKERSFVKRLQEGQQLTNPAMLFYIMIKYEINSKHSFVCNTTLNIDVLFPSDDFLRDQSVIAEVDEEVAQPLSWNSPETKPLILYILTPLLLGLVVLGLGIDTCNRIRRKMFKTQKDIVTDIKMARPTSSEQAVSLDSIAQEIKEIKELLRGR